MSAADLVPAAELVASVTGSKVAAVRFSTGLLSGSVSLPAVQDDLHQALRDQLIASGVTVSGVVQPGRAAELVIVCEILAAASEPAPTPAREQRLVLTAPQGTVDLPDVDRLDGFVLDVIRRARTSLHIGGAFWNEAGFDLLDEVLRPAIRHRRVDAALYVHTPDRDQDRESLATWLDELRADGSVRVHWYNPAGYSMLHAKFVIADRSCGYLGTANLTSWGLQRHIEAGVELTATQAHRFVAFLDELGAAGLFRPAPSVGTT